MVPAILGEVDDATAELARSRHAEEYLQKKLIDHAEALPGAPELLRALRARGVATALASSAKPDELARYLPSLGGAGAVDAIVTAQDVPTTKPAPHIFAVALSRLGAPSRALVVGDTVYDVEAAGKLGLPCVCLLTGGIERGTLLAAGAARVLDDARAQAQDLDAVLALEQPAPRA